MRNTLLAILLAASLLALPAWAQQTTAPSMPKGTWELLTTVQPYPHLWGVFPSADACAAGQKQLHIQAMNKLASMRGVTPDQFADAANKVQSLDSATCVQS